MSLLVRGARVVTPRRGGAEATGPLRGRAMGRLSVRSDLDVLVDGDRIVRVERDVSIPDTAEVLEARGRVLMPAFVDAHTHACWAGDRLEEWQQKLQGSSYQEVMAAGGGIMATVQAVRDASREELAEALLSRLRWMLTEGTTAVEVKSGYGLSLDAELKMLHAIRDAAEQWPGRVVATACLGHALDPEIDDFVTAVINEQLPAVSEAFPGITLDAYCEEGAWRVDDCVRLFRAAQERGHPIRVHADQFRSLGMVPEAIRLGARSVDHLEATTVESLESLARSGVTGVMLPVSGFHLDGRYADGRSFVDAGGPLVVATNWNPGSAPSPSIPLAMGLAVRELGLTPHEAITAVTLNAASLLGLDDMGEIRVGARADLVLLRHEDERELAHTVGGNPVAAVICGGRLRVAG